MAGFYTDLTDISIDLNSITTARLLLDCNVFTLGLPLTVTSPRVSASFAVLMPVISQPVQQTATVSAPVTAAFRVLAPRIVGRIAVPPSRGNVSESGFEIGSVTESAA